MCPEFLNGKKKQTGLLFILQLLQHWDLPFSFFFCLSSLKSLSCHCSARLHPLWLQRLRIKELADAAWVPWCTRHGLSLEFADLGPRNPKGLFQYKRRASPGAGQSLFYFSLLYDGATDHWPISVWLKWQGCWSRSLHRPWGLNTTLDQGCSWPRVHTSIYTPGFRHGSQIPEALALEAKLGGSQHHPHAMPKPALSGWSFPRSSFSSLLSA